MKKIALFLSAVLLFSAFLQTGALTDAPVALAAAGDEISLQQAFLDALISAGVDTNHDGKITEGEMAVPHSLEIIGIGITDLSGIEHATGLTSLVITGTHITGLPAGFSGLTGLTSLEISYNSLLTSFPDAVLSLTGLTTLRLQMNKIASLPAGIDALANLRELNLYDNGLNSLPDSIGNLTHLMGLYLQKNSLSALPDSIGNLTSLTELTVWDNSLSSLPASLGNLTALTERLDLSDNRLTALPSGVFDGMTGLQTLSLNYNYLDPQAGSPDRAEIDAAAAHGTAVSYANQKNYAVSLNYNGGTGASLPKARYYYGENITLPAATKQGYTFTGWDTDGNGTPDHPAGVAVAVQPNPVTATTVGYSAVYGYTVTFTAQPYGTIGGGTADIRENVNPGAHVSAVPSALPDTGYVFLGWYDGETPVTESDILGMTVNSGKTFTARFEAENTIHFADSAFKAALAVAGADDNGDGFITIGEMESQNSLTLSGGQFSNISGIEYALNLTSLTLGTGNVSALPDQLFNLTNLTDLDIAGNPIASLPPEFGNLIYLETLDIGGCRFSGLPSEVSGMTALRSIDASGNRFAAFPGALKSLSGLSSLDISDNLLTDLPADCFTGMTGLSSLDLSLNYFNPGSMPASTPGLAIATPQKTYAAILDFRGGSGDALPKPGYWYGEQVPLPEAAREGYIFVGWDTDGDGAADTTGAGFSSISPNPPNAIASKTFIAIYKSCDARLSGIALSAGGYLAPTFSPGVTEYTVTLYDYADTITFTPQKSDAHAAMRIDGAETGSASVTLASSADTDTAEVNLTAEDGVTTGSYTIHFVRASPVGLGLTGLSLSYGLNLSPAFSPSVVNYTALLPVSTGNATISAVRMDPLSTVTIGGTEGPAALISVNPGEAKAVSVIVSSPLTTDRTKVYTVTLKRGTAVAGFTGTPKTGATPVLSPYGTNRLTFSYTMMGPGTVKIEVYKSRKWVPVMTRAETSAGLKTWNWDGKAAGRTLSPGTYKVRITPVAYGMVGSVLTISVKIVRAPSVSWRSWAKKFKANGISSALCTFRANYPTNAVVQVYNARNRLAATVASFTNLPPANTAIAWNGKATAGNSAGLAAGSLVPAGTYSIRITVGTKVYKKTIKIIR